MVGKGGEEIQEKDPGLRAAMRQYKSIWTKHDKTNCFFSGSCSRFIRHSVQWLLPWIKRMIKSEDIHTPHRNLVHRHPIAGPPRGWSLHGAILNPCSCSVGSRGCNGLAMRSWAISVSTRCLKLGDGIQRFMVEKCWKIQWSSNL
jgi:hypothetical protein